MGMGHGQGIIIREIYSYMLSEKSSLVFTVMLAVLYWSPPELVCFCFTLPGLQWSVGQERRGGEEGN